MIDNGRISIESDDINQDLELLIEPLASFVKFYSEFALMGNVVQTDYGYSQAMSAGTCGALIYKPSHIVRFKDA